MSERVKHLRKQSIDTKPYVSTERAELLTDFYQSGVADRVSTPVARALALRYLMEIKTICINEGELIVGERGPAPRATPTYPELCCHTLEDLDVMNSRSRTRFLVNEDTRRIYREKIIPFWKSKTMRERVFAAMSEPWEDAFNSGVFTEFMEQRAPGHAVLDDKIYHKGLLDFKREIERSLNGLGNSNDPDSYRKEQELKAMDIAADALIIFARRHAEKAKELAAVEMNPKRKKELEKIADVCFQIPAHSPRDFWEALQMYWFVHLAVITELNVWDSLSPGRLDQHLYPFYRKDLEEGELSRDFARELLECFWVKFNNQPAPPKMDITEEQSATYQDFALINVGGLNKDGEDCVNELSYLILDTLEEMRLIQPSVCIQLSNKNPDRFLKRALEVVKAGFGQPSIFNTDVIIQEFLRAGKSMKDARDGGPSGCVTISAFGKESCTLTGYCNWPKIFELTLNNGIDPQTGKQIGLQTGDPSNFASFDELLAAYKKQLHYFVNLKIKGNNIIERLYADYMPAPFLSLLFDDCIEKGKDYHDGGPRYNSTYVQGVGIATLTDSLSAMKYHVFETKKLTMEELLEMLRNNFEGAEKTRMKLWNKTPKYGNDEDYADNLAQFAFKAYFDVLDGRPNTKGGEYRINLLPTTVHIYFGQITGATPNGRKAGEPVSEGISPSQGADTNGPTAVIKTAAKIDHAKTGGTLLNQKFMPQLLADETSMDKLGHLVRTYFKLGGHHVQFNVVDAETLRRAQEDPEKFRDLIVRVAGYSDYFVDIGKELQDEIIARTEHHSF
ncbi:MAG: glycyl radical protein [Candidatus Bathyarchaeota archaeon]|jgi:formate C-acetyltransferase